MIPVEISRLAPATFRAPCEWPAHQFITSAVMVKRTTYEGDAGSVHATKRQRIEGGHERNSPRPNGAGADEVHSARDLQKALYFDQNATAEFRNGSYAEVFEVDT